MKLNRIFWKLAFFILAVSFLPSNGFAQTENQTTPIDHLLQTITDNHTKQFKTLFDVNKSLMKEKGNQSRLLLKAAETGSIEIVKYLVAQGVNINSRSEQGGTGLMKAAYAGHKELVDWLLKNGADPRLEHKNGYEAFDWALESMQMDILKLLTQNLIAQPHKKLIEQIYQDESGFKFSRPEDSIAQSLILLSAVMANKPKLLSQLLTLKFNPDYHNMTGYAALPMAARLNRVEMVKTLLSAGANINLGNNGEDEASAINQAARAKNEAMLALLIEHGADVNKQNARGYSALHIAAFGNATKSAELLLAHGANPLAEAERGFTPLDYAFQAGSKTITSAIYSSQLQPKISVALQRYLSQSKPTTIDLDHELISNPFVQSILVINDKVDWLVPLFKDKKNHHFLSQANLGYPLLNLAVRFGHVDTVKQLIEFGSPVNLAAQSGYHSTPLIDATRNKGKPKVLKLLIANKAQVNQTDRFGDPAINWATYYGNHQLVKTLLNSGADPSIKSEHGYDAIRTAKEQNHTQIILLFERYLRTVKQVDEVVELIKGKKTTEALTKVAEIENLDHYSSNKTTLLIEAIQAKEKNLIQYLLENNVNVNLTRLSGYFESPLMLAVSINDISLIEKLLQQKSHVNALDKMGDSALNWAAYMGHEKIVARLLKANANTDIQSVHGNAYHIALRRGHRKIQFLIEQALVKNNEPRPEVFAAILNKDFSKLKSLVWGNKNTAKNQFGDSLMTFAVRNHCIACVEILLQSDQPVDQTDAIGFSGLMIASRNGNEAIAKLLLDHGAKIDLSAHKSGMSVNAIILAATHNHEKIIKMLVKQGANINSIDAIGNTALLWALSEGSAKSSDILLSLGADPMIKNNQGYAASQLLEQSSASLNK